MQASRFVSKMLSKFQEYDLIQYQYDRQLHSKKLEEGFG